MNTSKATVSAGAPQFGAANEMYPEQTTIVADLAAHGAYKFGSSSDDMWDGAVPIMVRLDDDDDMDSLKGELDLFRRENDIDVD